MVLGVLLHADARQAVQARDLGQPGQRVEPLVLEGVGAGGDDVGHQWLGLDRRRRRGGLVLGGLPREVLGDLGAPELVGLGGVDLELEALGHLRA